MHNFETMQGGICGTYGSDHQSTESMDMISVYFKSQMVASRYTLFASQCCHVFPNCLLNY